MGYEGQECHKEFTMQGICCGNGESNRPGRKIPQGKFGLLEAHRKNDSGKYKSYQESDETGYAPSISTTPRAGDVFLARERGGVEKLQVFKRIEFAKPGQNFR